MDILMPQLGETVDSGKVTTWFKAVGDAVQPGDNLFEIETDKVTVEVPSTIAGVLAEIRVPVGETAPVGAIVAVVADKAGATPSAPAATAKAPPKTAVAAPSAPAAATAPQPAKPTGPLDPYFEVRTPARNFGPGRIAGGIHVTPLARRLAVEAGIDLARVKGSGPHGRIVARDVETARASAPVGAAAGIAAGMSAAQVLALYKGVPHEEVPLDGMRKTIAARLVQAKQTVPHFYLTADIDAGALITLREQVNAALPKEGAGATKLSLNDFIIKSWATALQHVKAANAVWAEDRILRFQHSDIGVAVAIEGGLITPVVRLAETKTVSAISAEMKDLAARARERKLKPPEYQGGASAISNLGMYGVREFAAIINPPQSTLLAVGTTRRQAVERADGSVGFASMMTVTLSCDHRVVDGALGAELLAAFKRLVETPVTALV